MKNYLHILTLTAFLLGIIAPACGFSWGDSNVSVIEICTDKGVESRIVVSDEQQDDNPTPTIGSECQFCFANANLTSFLPDGTSIEEKYAYAAKLSYGLYEGTLLSQTTLSGQPRAPPQFV